MTYEANLPYKSVSVEAVVIRADGTREDLGTVAYWHRNPLRRLAWRARQLLLNRVPGRVWSVKR